jgi:hypothetical protein
MKLNVAKVLADEEIRKAMVKPLPRVKVAKTNTAINNIIAETKDNWEPIPEPDHKSLDNPLLDELRADFITVKKDRAILSSQLCVIVTEEEKRLRNENPELADLFLEGSYASQALQDHVARIEELTDRGAQIFDDIRYVEMNGKLPERVQGMPTQALSESVKALHYEIRRLGDRIHKTQKKMQHKKPKNPLRLAMWNEKIAYDDARRQELKNKLKKLQYEARAKRDREG